MPPKKKHTPLEGQTRLFAIQPSQWEEHNEEQHERTTSGKAEDDAQGTAQGAQSTREEQKEQKFHKPWLKKYSLLVCEKWKIHVF